MKSLPVLITNNSKADEYCRDKLTTVFLESGSYMDVLFKARDYIHMGHKLLSHPMAGSLKPNQTPYKSIVLESIPASKDDVMNSALLIESAIDAAEKFFRGKSLPGWSDSIKEDFKTVDLSFITRYVDSLSKGAGTATV